MKVTKQTVAQVSAELLAEGKTTATRMELVNAASRVMGTDKPIWAILTHFTRQDRGVYALSAKSAKTLTKLTPKADTVQPSAEAETPGTPAAQPKMAVPAIASFKSEMTYIPDVQSEYVKWGEFKNLESILKSRQFFPLWISGLSGNGKTIMVEQACAYAKVPYIRVQITPETDTDDLIGGFRLINGETVFCKGPVVKAMEDGAILLVDEIDRGTNKIMCLQGVLEGKPILIQKTGEYIFPKAGFNVIATANTLGRGSEDGRFTAASIIDDAFLERFVAVINQGWPTKLIEKKIILNHMEMFDYQDEDFADKLTSWAQIIRKTFEAEGVDEVISTRRLCHIVKSYSIFNDRTTAIRMCISRFDTDTSQAFIDLYTKVDAGELTAAETPAQTTAVQF